MKKLRDIWLNIRLGVIILIAFPILLYFNHRTHVNHLVFMMKAVLFKYLLLYYPELEDKWKNSDFLISLDYATSSLCSANFNLKKDDDYVFYEANVNDLIEKIKKIGKVNHILTKYYSIRIFLHLLYNKLVISNDIFESRVIKGVLGKVFNEWNGGLQFRNNLNAFNSSLIKFREIKEYQNLRKEIISEKKEIDRNFAKAYSLKIKLSSANISLILSFFSILFLITGYFYNYFLLIQYDIPVSNFFNLSDYLASSVEKIKYCLVGSGFALIYSYSIYSRYYRQLPWEKDYTVVSKMKSLKWVVIIAIILIGIGLIFNYSTNYYVIVSFFIVLFSIDNFSIFFSDRFFKDSVSSYFILFFLFTYILYFTYDTVKNYYGLENKKATNFIFEIKDNSIDMDNLKLINSNSNYFFFYDTIKLESVITERDNIKTIRIK